MRKQRELFILPCPNQTVQVLLFPRFSSQQHVNTVAFAALLSRVCLISVQRKGVDWPFWGYAFLLGTLRGNKEMIQ